MFYSMEREVNQVLWTNFLGSLGYDGEEYDNDTFTVRSYHWSDGEDDEDLNAWHFWHKPSGLKIRWYKYPLRGCCWNIPGLSHEFFLEILKDCSNSMEEDRGGKTKFLYDVHKWWLINEAR